MPKILTIESTCDETAAAIVNDQFDVLGAVVASQEKLHERYHGVVPELAARAHLERIIPVIEATLKRAECDFDDLDAIAVATTPGLAGSLLIGLIAAKTLALVHDLPLISVNHLHAHIYACQIGFKRDVFPCVGFVVSGGHSNFYSCPNPSTFEYLGGTIDDAAGEAFDKVATMLGLGYPGGPQVSKLAVNGNDRAYRFPRPFVNQPERLEFSFSGLKTAVRYAISDPTAGTFQNDHLTEQEKADLAASFEAAVVDCLVAKSIAALELTGVTTLCVGGGVAANPRLRRELSQACEERNADLWIAPFELCTDNAVMGAIAFEKFHAGLFEDLSLDIVAGLERAR